MAKKKLQEEKELQEVNLLDGLEEENKTSNTVNVDNNVTADACDKFDDIEFLKTADPRDYKDTGLVVPAYKPELEDKVHDGMEVLEALIGCLDKDDNMIIDPNVLLLAKWWQVKPARVAIKKIITATAAKKNMTFDFYMNVEIERQVENWKKLDYAIGRLKVLTTFLKPRHGLEKADKQTCMNIDGKIYSVKLSDIVRAKYDYKNNEDRKAFLKSVSEEMEIDVVETI